MRSDGSVSDIKSRVDDDFGGSDSELDSAAAEHEMIAVEEERYKELINLTMRCDEHYIRN